MNNTGYAYAVANVRAKENELLTPQFLDQLINAPSFGDFCKLLADKGIITHNAKNAEDEISRNTENAWDYIMEIAPEKEALYFMVAKNDFHNLKALMKGFILGTDSRNYCISPCIIDIDDMYDIVKNKKFDLLPKWIADTASEAYKILTATMDGQLFDMFIDKASLGAMIYLADESGYDFSSMFANEFAALTNIKIALRIAGNIKSDVFLDYAFAQCRGLDISALKKAVLKGREEVLAYVGKTEYDELLESISKSFADFERECDNRMMRLIYNTKFVSLGIEPLIAYYYAKETESKMLRIISNTKHADLSADVVMERMRDLYV